MKINRFLVLVPNKFSIYGNRNTNIYLFMEINLGKFAVLWK